VKNCAALLDGCLKSIVANQPWQVIVVDGRSTDGTIEVARAHGAEVISDEGRGLGHARKVGVIHSTGDNILFVGPDNILPPGFISEFLRLKQEWGFDAASAQTRVFEPRTFWDKGLDFRWRCLMGTPGPRSVVGTPSLYNAELLKKANFDETAGASDDTDVGERLTRLGYRLGVVPIRVYDQNGMDGASMRGKFRWYGRGDARFFQKHAPQWTLTRKLRSLTHPLRQTLQYSQTALKERNAAALAWLWIMAGARYRGWITEHFTAVKQND
jgi:glycosyltransferase involved in cell wall biosynthesis